ncbi:molybdenum cofactor biosynthesis protein C [Thermocrinis albus DSM 14484]|uniref:cyclic pyranopterin monophosphate synthase n=1 Tax=Thermocrinis albus (strain DSM 14484 / JCM 11386 / HI 11/12) TaxID=638303 RepID=D3SNG7_THEAH|nr:cyclic pyranopterin monophosphate synthase MoaC [Thermocrinis albus]ADC88704.1 molybdenum cofactor biosynthesis protein C [Thermocrinis albus DSM 14484]
MRTVDVSVKPQTLRQATACGRIKLKEETIKAIREGRVPKGDVLAACQLAGVMAVKRTSDLLPFCHPLMVDHVEVSAELKESFLEVRATVRGVGRTGYEMEALTAVCVALLTVYDMCKGIDDSMVIEEVKLTEKTGGRSQWGTTLKGKRVFVDTETSLRKLIEDHLLRLKAHILADSQEKADILITTREIKLDEEFFGLEQVVNATLFSFHPTRLRHGVRLGRWRGLFCVVLEKDELIVDLFFTSFGELMAGWLS